MNARSVVTLPFERMLAMLRERCSRESQSAIVYLQPFCDLIFESFDGGGISVSLRVSVAELGAEPLKDGPLFILPRPSDLSQQP